MHKGRLIRIVLLILIVGMASYLFIRNNQLKKQVANGERTEISARDFLPFGTGQGDGIINSILNTIIPGRGDNDKNINNRNLAILIQENVAGATLVEREDEIAGPTGVDLAGNNTYDLVTAIRYVTMENGYVYDYIPKYKKSYLISDTPIPKVSFAYFSTDGDTILFQYLDTDLTTEKSVLGRLGVNNIRVLPDNLLSFAFSKNGEFAYFKRTLSGSSLVLESANGTETILYDSPLTEWNVQFLENDMLITTKASERAPGFSYIINKNTKKVTSLWSNITGLTTKASPSGNFIIRGETLPSGPKLSLYNNRSGALTPINKMGLTEKCSFSKDETLLICGLPRSFENKLYPDAWYTGEIKTDDGIARYTTENLNEHVLPNISEEVGTSIDTWQTAVNNAGNIHMFINRENMSLWIYEE